MIPTLHNHPSTRYELVQSVLINCSTLNHQINDDVRLIVMKLAFICSSETCRFTRKTAANTCAHRKYDMFQSHQMELNGSFRFVGLMYSRRSKPTQFLNTFFLFTIRQMRKNETHETK